MNASTTQCRSQYQLQETMQTGMGHVVPHAWNDRPGSSMEEDPRSDFEAKDTAFSCADFDFNFSSCTFSEAEQGLFFPGYMSPADELFHNGKIRPLQPVAQLQAMSFSHEQALVAQMQVLEDRAFKPRRPPCIYSSVSAPASPVNPSSKVETCPWSPGREVIMPARRHSPGKEKERGKEETTPAVLKGPVLAKDGASSQHVVYRRCRSMSSTKVFHVDNEAHNMGRTYEEKESSESTTLACGGASESQRSKTTHKKRTLKELLQKEDLRKQLMSKLDSGPRSVESGKNEEIRKKGGGLNLHPAVSELVLQDQWRWSKDRPGAIWARSPKAVSPHERHYAAQKAQTDRMRKKTFLPYRQGLLGCLGFNTSPAEASFRSTHSHLSTHNRPHPPVVY